MIGRKLALRDLCAGLGVILVGGFAVWEASSYPFGTLRSIGSGFFPVMLGLLALPLGAAILWEAATRPRDPDADAAPLPGETDLRAVAAVVAALLAFVVLIDRAGLVPAIFVAVVVASFAERAVRPGEAVLLAAAMACLCAAIFVFGLGLPIRLVAW